MKSQGIALTCLLGLTSAQLFLRDTGAECHAKDAQTCPTPGLFGCEDNGGHSLECTTNKFWVNKWNCPDYDAHCDCRTGKCAPNDANNNKVPKEALSNPDQPNTPDPNPPTSSSGEALSRPAPAPPAPAPNSIQPPAAVAATPGYVASAGPDGVVASAPGAVAGVLPASEPSRRDQILPRRQNQRRNGGNPQPAPGSFPPLPHVEPAPPAPAPGPIGKREDILPREQNQRRNGGNPQPAPGSFPPLPHVDPAPPAPAPGPIGKRDDILPREQNQRRNGGNPQPARRSFAPFGEPAKPDPAPRPKGKGGD